jgi:hypothetical protein
MLRVLIVSVFYLAPSCAYICRARLCRLIVVGKFPQNGCNWIVSGCSSNNSISSRSNMVVTLSRQTHVAVASSENSIPIITSNTQWVAFLDKSLRAKFLTGSNWRFNAEARSDAFIHSNFMVSKHIQIWHAAIFFTDSLWYGNAELTDICTSCCNSRIYCFKWHF